MNFVIVTRFAPSPTGRLHIGHAASAIRAHDHARTRGGRVLLRIEDIDGTRSRPEFIAGIEEDLRWLGLTWDGPALRQSARLDAYTTALDRLRGMGLLYRCFCTRAEIAASLSAPHGGPDGPLYPGTCRRLSAADAAARAAAPHCWRIDMAAAVARTGPLGWDDAQAGDITANPLAHGDVVLARKDAPASYHLAVTVDDAWQGVTDVVRGADLFAATDVHRLLQALLGLPTPRYHHHPLLTDAAGKRLAKRDGAPTLAALRDRGTDGIALAAALRAGRLPDGTAAASA
ncbi:tRNA glutamyl-Q(34) synthetase GluQRS [Sphingomonas sp. NFR15]|uniref:tRNA glutamyl-Q(34) synthetase GluQRS n=1 Tax=Sphingomonas sp. NFR15 TaxID=1566282 RepID=UPI00088CE3EB|nr:tRNA glutamyl-Q(34) synthetase GluQRS [Sphingomonas sp. NFR15]SDA25753.1 glutamyl-Q tRNA(Asp) synthetase [Sphingomonas sp. NFR15]